MREIKFRAWVVNSCVNEMMYPSDTQINSAISKSLQYQLGYEDAYPEKNNIEQWQKDIIFMQFTGLQDRDGNNVYEGDILETADRILKVVWHNHAGQWDTDFIRYKGELLSNGLRNLEWKYRATIIGNIYENPELLSTPTAVL